MSRATFVLAAATTAAVFVLLVVGGTVNPTGSSLACPDWPTCHGSFFPAMRDGVQFEHTHRVVATAVGLLTVVLASRLWRSQPRSFEMKALGVSVLAMVVLQGLLGGITVLLRLPLVVSASHLALSMLVFAFFIYLSFRLWPRDQAPESRPIEGAPRRTASGVAALVIYGQILLGALVRHTHAGRACGDDIPWCLGELWPSWGPSQLHMLHRMGGVATVAVVLIATWLSMRSAKRTGRRLAWRLATLAPWLVAAQFLLGVLTVTSNIGVPQVTAHLALGALLLADFTAVWLALGPADVRHPSSQLEVLATSHEVTS